MLLIAFLKLFISLNIKTIYKINLDTEILDAIEKISDEGNGVDFRNKVRDQKWKCETFTWVSDSG